MGKFRSRSGCLTCRVRRVKCAYLTHLVPSTLTFEAGDETRPVCKACGKKNRPCQWEEPHTKFKDYRPDGPSSIKSATGGTDDENEAKGDVMDVDDVNSVERGHDMVRAERASEGGRSRDNSPRIRKNSRADGLSEGQASVSSPSATLSPPSPYYVQRAKKALLVHHYTEHLGRWLDCTDATRQFTLGVPEKVKHCPVLCHAVLSFAARHCREDTTAEAAYERCIALLIERLNEDAASHDETLLCAIVILRFYEQLNVPSSTGSDNEQHLAGCSAIIRSSQGHHFVDPSAPTLREAAFWVYVRQCLYNATINQQPPDIDFSLKLHPSPDSMRDAHPLARLRLETAWANQMTWNLARVVHFCYDGNEYPNDRAHRPQRWQELWNLVQKWMQDRPQGFNAIFESPTNNQSSFPDIWFTADWHVVSFGFYHFACIMLLRYKPGPKFAIRHVGSLSPTDHQILSHARAICGASRSSPETVPLAITVCHTIFIWGPLVLDPIERGQVVEILTNFEKNHVWPTTWIINAVKDEWGVSATSASPT
ncbi:hypothetical protein HRS9139_03393 [Pyrenophora teres f. teres]|nr:hypothetical protein HRS9139_03393 [Pyrenophora teres f. teres]